MLDKVNKALLKVFGSRNERLIKAYSVISQQVGEFEEEIKKLDDDALRAKTDKFKAALEAGAKPEDILPEAFAVVREVARRNVDMRHFDVQLIGGNVLYEGKIAEMATGEGKTLVATLAVYLVYLTGRRVHIVTVNDYLAKRDAEWMGPIYNALGLTVGAIQADMDTAGDDRKNQYACDITYGTNNEFGFDYLRDNMKTSPEQMVQGQLQYAIIDEVDSILIDEARTPLIISGPAFDDVSRYKQAEQVARKLMSLQSNYDRIKKRIDTAERTIANAQGELAEAKRDKDNKRIEKAQEVIEKTQGELEAAQAGLTAATQYYEVEYDRKAAHLTHEGVGAAQEIAGVGSFFTGSNMEWPHLLEQSLRAHVTFEREADYVVMDGKVIIVDEFTGRLMHGRQWSDGLHQAVEAKENVTIKEETQTLATITLQNFFKLYGQIAGMTGTAATEAEEFMNIYKLEVVVMPTNEPCIREDRDDIIYKSIREKFNAIVQEISDISHAGRPVLVGTVSVEKNEALSAALTKNFGLDHELLNAKHHEREATIVTKAGQQHKTRDGQMRGNVTIATNMAGRGTDIKLGPGVAEIGGLHVLGTERHEARRIDNQLRGRCGRQGDLGSSEFFLSFDDDLMRIFAPEWTVKALSWIGWEEGQPIVHGRISKGIEKAQKKVEERNFEIRKSLLEYDEVMDYQRNVFYSRRRSILAGKGLKNIIEEMIDSAITNNCETILNKNYPSKCIIEWARTNFAVDLKESDVTGISAAEIEKLIKEQKKDNVANDISLSMGEYLEDYDDALSWDIAGLCKWAMSAFSVSLSPGKIKHQSPEEIEEQLISAAAEQIDKKDCSQLIEFLKEDFAVRTFAEWARAKFDIRLEIEQLKALNAGQIRELLKEQAADKYRQREIEYPVEFAMNMVFGPQGTNIYAFEALADWANKKYDAGLSAEQIQNVKPRALHKQLLELSESFNDGQLDKELDSKVDQLSATELVSWANERFNTSLTEDELSEGPERREKLSRSQESSCALN
jgi:preprotein translocase subunit SecA